MAAQQPTYQAYTVVKRDGQDDFWLNIGAAFMHQDGDGFNIMLQAFPINGKIVLRPPKGEPETRETGPSKDNTVERDRQTVRDANDRRRNTRRDK
jgi:hypothetical protein